MKIVQIYRTDEEDYRSWLEISIDGKRVFSIGSGEPEDMTLFRDLSDAHNVVDMMQKAYEAGKNGEEFEVENKEVKGWD